uniref:Uncharacterized protein n=1 Tax=Cucumis melo TaxID=3656 RepID=A0A9I9CHS3_CUCME
MARRARPGCGSVQRRRMDGPTSSTQMGDHDGGGWVRGDATMTVGASRTNSSWRRHNPLASTDEGRLSPEISMERREARMAATV